MSDIHGDIHLLIVLLRDCCRVIKKKDGFTFDRNRFDYDLDSSEGRAVNNPNTVGLLLHNLNNPGYIDDLNYEWCGGNSHIVLVGDILDNSRERSYYQDGDRRYGEYIHEEIKILKFINAINKQANLNGGKIIKLIGNHEFENLENNTEFIDKYTSGYSKLEDCNYREQSRLNYFSFNGVCANLLSEDGIGVILKINDWIFVHGGISDIVNSEKKYIQKKHENFLTSAKSINDTLYNLFNEEYFETAYYLNTYSVLWNRDLSQNFNYKTNFCSNLQETFKLICKNENSENIECQNNLRIVVGHTVQEYFVNELSIRPTRTFTRLVDDYINRLNGIEILKAPDGGIRPTVEEVSRYFDDSRKKGIVKPIYQISPRSLEEPMGDINGITVDCERNGTSNHPAIFRVDVGASRAMIPNGIFGILNGSNEELKIKFLKVYLTCPQVLHIRVKDDGSYEESIIRSTKKNYVTHVPLPINQDLIDRIKRDEIPEILPIV